jgi:hypothetical protein
MKASGADKAPVLRPPGEIYKETMAKEAAKNLQAAPPAPPADETKVAEDETKPAKDETKGEEKPAKAAKAKPKSALDAALSAEVDVEKVEDVQTEEDHLAGLDEELPADKAKRSEQWKKARGVIDTISGKLTESSKRIAELETQIQSGASPAPELQAKLEKLEKENAEYKDALVALNVKWSPDYQNKYVKGRAELVKRASDKATVFGADGPKLAEALGMQEGRARTTAIAEVLGDLHEGERSRVWDFINQIDRLDDESREVEKDPQDAWAKLQETETERKKQKEAEAADYRKKVFNDTTKKMPAKLLLLRTVDPEIEGAKAHNEQVATIREAAWRLLNPGIPPQELAEKAYWAEAAPILQNHLVATRKELVELQKRLADYEQAEPGFRGDKQPALSDHEAKLKKSPGQIYAEKMRDLRGGLEEE